MKNISALLAACSLALSACAGHGGFRPEDETSERAVLQALASVHASDAQRLQVMAAFDTARPRLRADQAQIGSIGDQLDSLSPQAPDYVQHVGDLAARWAEARADALRTQAGFDHAVATTLDAGQWDRWQEMFSGRGVGDEGGGGRGRRS